MSRRPLSLGRSLAALVALAGAGALAPVLAIADTCAGLDLAALSPAATGTAPSAVAVGDFDRNGLLDVAVANAGSNNVTILFGNGLGGFSPGPSIATGATSSPADIAAGDLDRDGFLDLVVAFGTTPQAKVLRGLPGGAFDGTISPFALNATPTRVYLADFDRDADLDLVVISDGGQRILLYGGATATSFNPAALTDISLFGAPGERPAAAAVLDFNRDGRLDLAVATAENTTTIGFVRVYFGNGGGGLPAGPSASLGTGAAAKDVIAGDVNRDGWLDLVTANSGTGTASVVLNTAGASLTPQPSVTVGGVPLRAALVDLDHDAVLDLAAIDDSATPRVSAFRGLAAGPPWFDASAAAAALPPLAGVRGLAVGRFTADGRQDLVTALASPQQAVVIENRSGTPCGRSSFASAPRSFLTLDGPVSTAAADFDGDGRQDLVVATNVDRFVRILRNVNGELSLGASIGPLSPAPRGVAVADLDFDGDMDVVVAQGDAGSGQVQVLLGNGTGGLALGAAQPSGANTAAVVIADFNGDGAPDVAAASEGAGQVFRFLGDGAGGLGTGVGTFVGTGPRALVAADLNGDGKVDLAVANSGGSDVKILGGNGDGTFTGGPLLAVGSNPYGIAAAQLNADTQLDLVTADNGSGQVSVVLGNGAGGYLAAIAYPVGSFPTAVALIQLDGDPKPDIAVTSASSTPTLSILANNGAGGFVPASDAPVRQFPQAITPIDADGDGLADLAVPCRSADAVVVLINRPPGPPVLSAAPRFAAGDQPRAAVAADLDNDGDLDLAVASKGSNVVSLLRNTGTGGFNPAGTLAASQVEALAVADFNLDGNLDVAASAPGSGSVEIFLGTGGGSFGAPASVPALGTPDDLVAGDFDRDGDLDLAVCDKVTSLVRILRNNGPGALGTFSAGPTVGVGVTPTAIVAADFDRDGDLDLAVANDDSDNTMVLTNSGGTFALGQTLALTAGDQSPVSVAAGDFDGDGALDLAVAAFGGDRIHVYRNNGSGTFVTPETTFDAPIFVTSLSIGDINRDGRPDLVVAAGGLSVFRGRGAMDFDPAQTVVAGYMPVGAVAGDLNRDGRVDLAVVNEGSDDVSVFTSTACQPQHLELAVQPSACSAGSPPFFLDAQVKAFDDGGNLASCATNTVTPTIVPGTGDPLAVLGGGGPQSMAGGVATWTGGTALSIDRPGRRYRVQFQAGGFPPVQSRSFTLGSEAMQIVGPASVCPSTSGVYALLPDPGFDTYAWQLDGAPHSFNPTATLSNPPITLGGHALGVSARVDGCVVTPTPPVLSVYFGDLSSVTLDVLGASSVCVNCIGGSAKAIETGGGAATRQWGYRTTTGGTITPLAGETGDIYVLKGASFPGPGTYYVVVTSTPACGLPMVSTEWTVTVVEGSGTGEVLHLAALSRGGPSTGENKLMWVNTTAPLEVLIRWNKAADGTTTCVSPSSPTSPPVGPTVGETSIAAPAPNAKDSFLHPALVINTAYCYSVFVRTGAGWSAGRTVKARPFDSTTRPGSSVKWAYATGGSAVAPPTVSGQGILAMSNDRTVHALTRGVAGGDWPVNWMPTGLAGVAHSRSPVVPFTVPLAGADTVLFTADDAGFVHAIDARTGNRPWPAQGPALSMTGAPGGMFTQYLGIVDGLLVGTRDNLMNNQLRLLKLADGTLLEAYSGAGSPGPIGPINGSPAIDYATRRVYFASHKRLGGDTLFCVELAAAAPHFTWKWSRDLGNVTGSPVLVGNRVIVSTDAGVVYSVNATSGDQLDDHTYSTLDGPAKGFLFPDRRGDDLIFATNTKVWSLSDVGPTMTVNWVWDVVAGLNPSIVLYRPNSNLVYVGSHSGELYELDFTSATIGTPPSHRLQVLGGGQGQVGAPSLDISRDLGPPETLIVGSEPGVVYLLELPFPLP